MKINILGTGCSWTKRKNTSFIIDDSIVFDVPNGAYKDIISTIEPRNVNAVLISHMHGDHFLDFRLLAKYSVRNAGIRNDRLRVYGPKGIFDKHIAINKLLYGTKSDVDKETISKYIEFIELQDGKSFTEGHYKITPYKVSHQGVPTFGFTFEENNGTKFAFSADSCPCDALDKMLEKTDYAFWNMASTKPVKNHMCPLDFMSYVSKFPNCKFFPIHTCDATQEYAETNNMNALSDGQELNL